MKVYFRHPESETANFELDMPAVPRQGEDVETDNDTFTVERVVWFTNPDDPSPYVILA